MKAGNKQVSVSSPRGRVVSFVARVCFSAAAVASLGMIGLLFWRAAPHFISSLNYSAIGKLLIAFVAAVGGLVAVRELLHNQYGARTAANAAIFDQCKMYLSINYQQEVRRPAWLALYKAREELDYRKDILAGLSGEWVGNETAGYIECLRNKKEPTPEDERRLYVHDGYHRIQDILGFFTTLSRLSDDGGDIKLCDFFYDHWRCQLRWIVGQLDEYQFSARHGQNEALKVSKEWRVKRYKETLEKLDWTFDWPIESFPCDQDTRFTDPHAMTARASVAGLSKAD